MSRDHVNTSEQYSRILDRRTAVIEAAVTPHSRLCRSGLIETRPSSSVINGVTLRRRSLRKLATTRIQSVDELRSEGRRVGKEWVSKGRSRWSPSHYIKQQIIIREITRQ